MKTYDELTNAIMGGSVSAAASSESARPAAAAALAPASHSTRPRPRLCRFFFQNGCCRNGDACRFSHDADGLTREEALKTIPCPYFAAGTCRFGEHCMLSHGEDVGRGKPGGGDDDAVCGICLESVRSLGRSFGVLSCCDHVYCFECLMEWRTEGSSEVTSRRFCPTCRKASDYVVPSAYMPANEEEKERMLQSYKDKLSAVPCKHFDGTLGSCSFGSNCFYAHLNSRGEDTKSRDKTMQQLYEERQRQRDDRRGTGDIDSLTEMILMMGLQRHLNRHTRRRGRNRRGRDDESDDELDMEDFISTVMATLMETSGYVSD
ncbi:hypothetical protein ACHAWF_012196 [Thalassiosira exigua]